MTREEAIRIFRKEIECLSHTKCEDCILEKACDPMNTTPYDSEYIEAYSMAIKALEELPKLQNRCYALTHGLMCVFCPYECEHKAESEVNE